MKDILEFTLAAIVITALVFLFKGNPSVFDLLREKALAELSQK